MKYSIITYIFNNYDLLRTPLIIDKNAEYICITDNKDLKSNIWKIIYEPQYDTNSLSGIQKTLMTKYSAFNYVSDNSKYIITIDSSILIKRSFKSILEYMEKHNYEMSFAVHNERSDFTDEYNIWMSSRGLNKIYFDKFINYYDKYYKNKFDLHNTGLIQSALKFFKNSDITKQFLHQMYNSLQEQSNFEDLNDQCMITCTIYDYIEKTNIMFFNPAIYTNGYYINMHLHNTNIKIENMQYNGQTYVFYNKYNVNIVSLDKYNIKKLPINKKYKGVHVV